jgi:hypothetical protein
MKILYFKNISRNKLNNILFANICVYILIKIYGQRLKVDYVNNARW